MDIKIIRTVLFVTLVVMVIGCGGRGHQAVPVSLPRMPETVEEVPTEKFESATVTASRLNLRSIASTKGKVLGVLQKGDRLEIVSYNDNWLEVVKPDGQKGWVYDRYVQTDNEIGKKPPKKSTQQVKPKKYPPKSHATKKAIATPGSKTAKKPPAKRTQKPSDAVRKKLESVWKTHRQAHRNADLALIKKTTSNHTHVTLQNELAAVGKELKSEDVTALYEMMPDLAKLKFVELKQNGPTAGLLYLDEGEKSDDSNLPSPLRFVFVKFVKEARGWTVDGMQSAGKPKYQKDGSETRFDYAELPVELAVDGKVRAAPKVLEKPKEAVVEGMIDISSYDYKTEVSINGIQQKGMEGAASSGPIAGGLNKGQNKIEIMVTKSAKAQSDWPPEVTVRYLNASGEEQEGFKFTPEENVVGRHEFTFTAN